MKHRQSFSILVVGSVIVCAALAPRLGFAQESPDAMSSRAQTQADSGNNKEAAAIYETLLKNNPTWMGVSNAQFQLGYLQYVLNDYDKSLENLHKVTKEGSTASPELKELAGSLVPQVFAAKAARETNEAKRKTAYEVAIKEFDVFLKAFPNGEEAEGASYGKALAMYQIAKYDEAIAVLRENLTKFAASPSILDSHYLLALTLSTQGSLLLQADSNSKAGIDKYDQAEKLLSGIIASKRDVALANEAQFQIGEMLFNRALAGAESDRVATWTKAIEAYRAVQPKEEMVAEQEKRLAQIREFKLASLKALNKAKAAQAERFLKSETAKLSAIKEKADTTVSAQLKIGQIYFQEQAYDEARVLFRQMQQFADDEEQKKTCQYYITSSYAYQKLNDKAVQAYNDFNTAFKADPMGDNLPLLIGSLFLTSDPQTSNPEKAAQFFKEGMQLYPKGHCVNEILVQQANSLIQLKRYDEALATYTDFLKRKPKEEYACGAEFGIGTVYKETGKIPQAIAQYKKVRQAYPKTPQGEQAFFWVAQLTFQQGDAATAVKEFEGFLKAFPKSELFPTAKFSLAQAYAAKKDSAKAMQLYKEVGDEFPKSMPAPFTYFQRANMLAEAQKSDEMVALMKEFIQKYPEDDKVFFAYDSVGQSATNAGKTQEAIACYTEMVEKHPKDAHAAQALFDLLQLWHQYAVAQGRYLALTTEQRVEWNKGIQKSLAGAEKLLADYPESEQVGPTLQEAMECEKMLIAAKLKTEADITKYFQELAGKFESKPDTKSKILFSLASFIYDSDKVKGLEMMKAAYSPTLIYAPEVIDLYGSALIDAGKVDESAAVYQKLAKDFPNPPGVEPDKAPTPIMTAQAIALYGKGKALQKKDKKAEAQAVFESLEKFYPWSPKLLDAHFGIAEGMAQQGKLDEAVGLLGQIIRAQTATADLRANSMFLLGGIEEKKGDIASAIDQYVKISMFYEGVPKTAAEGLWKGAQLVEQQLPSLPEKATKKGESTRGSQLTKAILYYKDLVTKYPSSPHAAEAGERLKALEPK